MAHYAVFTAARTCKAFFGHVQPVRLFALALQVRFILSATITHVLLPGATEAIEVNRPSRCSDEHRYYLVFTQASGLCTLSRHYKSFDAAMTALLKTQCDQHVELVSGHRWMNSRRLFTIQASNHIRGHW